MSNESNITVITPKSLPEARELASIISKSSLLPQAFRGKEAETLMAIMTGSELGLAPMQSLRAIDVIQGRPTLKAEAMVALVRARKDVCEYLIYRHSDATRCTIETKRVGDPSPTTMSFTIEEARTAGLLGNDNYKKFPAPMLRARCGSAVCKAVYSDVILGLYDPDELAPEPAARTVDATPAHRMPIHDVVDPKASPPPAPVSAEDARIEQALESATTLDALNALVPSLGALKGRSPAYERLRARWGVRRDELKAAPPPEPAPHMETEGVPS